jgi:LuxR family maltose regulon positive regulatory protein
MVWLATGRLDLVIDWMTAYKKRMEYPASHLTLNEDSLVYCRALITSNEKNNAYEMLQSIQINAANQDHKLLLIQSYLLFSLSADSPSVCMDFLQKAIHLAEFEGYERVFLDESPELINLLKKYRQQTKFSRSFIDRLLDAYTRENSKQTGMNPAVFPVSDIETLTEREHDVLMQIARGASNQEIADRFVVSIHTVKKHAANIFIKLGVQNRTEAVNRGRELGLI